MGKRTPWWIIKGVPNPNHDPEKSFFNVPLRQQYSGKILDYKKRGCDCLILWDDELDDKKDVVGRIRRFVNT